MAWCEQANTFDHNTGVEPLATFASTDNIFFLWPQEIADPPNQGNKKIPSLIWNKSSLKVVIHNIYVVRFTQTKQIFVLGIGNSQGIFPDIMHITHLALLPDVITSCLLDWTDDARYVPGTSRDKRLAILFDSYKSWCECQQLGERAARRLFTSSILKPDVGKYVEVSQKIINATAARYFVFWLSSVAKQFSATGDAVDEKLTLQNRKCHFCKIQLGCFCVTDAAIFSQTRSPKAA